MKRPTNGDIKKVQKVVKKGGLVQREVVVVVVLGWEFGLFEGREGGRDESAKKGCSCWETGMGMGQGQGIGMGMGSWTRARTECGSVCPVCPVCRVHSLRTKLDTWEPCGAVSNSEIPCLRHGSWGNTA